MLNNKDRARYSVLKNVDNFPLKLICHTVLITCLAALLLIDTERIIMKTAITHRKATP